MINKIDEYINQVEDFETSDKKAIERFRIQFLGKKGVLKMLFSSFKTIPDSDKKHFGQKLNQLKDKVENKLKSLNKSIESQAGNDQISINDLTRPGEPLPNGSRHPISIVRNRIIDIFGGIGFTLSEGPEIEDDWHNFTALNLPEDHPARDMQDTFFIEKDPDILLRTHTSSVQIRHMQNHRPPIRILSPGRVFRNEAVSSRAHCIFHQIEGLYINEKVSFADLKQTIQYFTTAMFGKSKIRLRPSYFPFTEPSAEVDIYWGLETEADYRITKGTGWLEIMGCGMVDPNVLNNVEIDPEKYSGFAFGMGIERIAMLLYQINDLRMFFQSDVRFLKQFDFV